MANHASLRVALHSADRSALLLRADLTHELYFAVHLKKDQEFLRTSYHETGLGRAYAAASVNHDRLIDRPRPPLPQFAGRERMWRGSFPVDLLDWDYTIRSQRRRVNLELDLESLPPQWFVDGWIVEGGRQDLVDQTLHEYAPVFNVIGYALTHWSSPQLLAVAAAPLEPLHSPGEESVHDALARGVLLKRMRPSGVFPMKPGAIPNS